MVVLILVPLQIFDLTPVLVLVLVLLLGTVLAPALAVVSAGTMVSVYLAPKVLGSMEIKWLNFSNEIVIFPEVLPRIPMEFLWIPYGFRMASL